VATVDPPEPPEPTPPDPGRTHLTGWEAGKVHITLVLVLALCLSAFWFEVRRALGGNELSWAYVFEWPIFAVFGVYMWWTTLHQNRRRRRTGPRPKVVAPEHVQMLRNWQEHQRALAKSVTEAESDSTGGRVEGGSAS
jgi:hypothetical protein